MLKLTHSLESRFVHRSFRWNGTEYTTAIDVTDGEYIRSEKIEKNCQNDARDIYDSLMLRKRYKCVGKLRPRELKWVDAFCGFGGFSLAAEMACGLVGLRPRAMLSIDTDEAALKMFKANFPSAQTLSGNMDMLVDYNIRTNEGIVEFAYPPEFLHRRSNDPLCDVDLLIAGPPCQGHSNFNNRTRRDDPRNLLYLSAVGLAAAISAKMIVIENVPDVIRDRFEVVRKAKSLLQSIGYHVIDAVLNASDFGVAQNRRRHFLIGSIFGPPLLHESVEILKRPTRNVRWAIGDLEVVTSESTLDRPSVLSRENTARIDFLFDNDRYELPNKVRPTCHQEGHTYPSVYGRLSWDKQSGAITQGFLSPGRGRFIHPSQRRTLTLREGARLQGIPDWYVETAASEREVPVRNKLTKAIGEAVPPQLGIVPILSVLLTDQRD